MDPRTRCTCREDICLCARGGKPIAAPPGLAATLTAAARSRRAAVSVPIRPAAAVSAPQRVAAPRDEREHWTTLAVREAYLAGLPYTPGAPLDDRTASLADAYAGMRMEIRDREAAVLLDALRVHALHRSAMLRRERASAAEVRRLGPVGALVASIQRSAEAQRVRAMQRLDALYGDVHGLDGLELLRLRRRVDMVLARRA